MKILVACEESQAVTKNSAIAPTMANKAFPGGVPDEEVNYGKL